MPAELSYMPTVTNVPRILEKIQSAATPPKFTNEFLKTNLGFGSSNDRSVIKVLKSMGFLSSDGTPTALYNEFRGSNSGRALAKGVRHGYSPLFLSDERIFEKSGTDLLGIVKNTSGAGDAVAKKIATTFKAFSEKADWSEVGPESGVAAPIESESETEELGASDPAPPRDVAVSAIRLHHDIHIHLPPTSDVSVYRAIFQAMKSELI